MRDVGALKMKQFSLQSAFFLKACEGGKEEKNENIGQTVNNFIGKLPFNRLCAKMPSLSKFSKYANYAFCLLVLCLVLFAFSGGSPQDEALDELENIVERMESLVARAEDGEVSYEGFVEQYTSLMSDVSSFTDDHGIDDDDLSEAQKKNGRVNQLSGYRLPLKNPE